MSALEPKPQGDPGGAQRNAAHQYCAVERKQADVKRKLEKIVFSLYFQIRYGCDYALCTIPTCYSCRRRCKSAPARRPTELTAWIQAFSLAEVGQGEVESRICPRISSIIKSHQRRIAAEGFKNVAQGRKDTKSLPQNLFERIPQILYSDARPTRRLTSQQSSDEHIKTGNQSSSESGGRIVILQGHKSSRDAFLENIGVGHRDGHIVGLSTDSFKRLRQVAIDHYRCAGECTVHVNKEYSATEKSRRSYEQSGPSDDCHTLSLVKEALSYIFGDVRNLYQSFQDGDGESSADSLARLAQCDAYSAFEGWTDIVGGLIFNSLRYSLDGLATDINLPASAMTAGHQKDSSESVAAEHVADEKSSPTTTKAIPVLLPGDPITWKEAHISHICVIAIFALVSEIKYQNLFDIMASRAAGQAYSQFDVDNPLSTAGALGILDALEYEPARSLTAQLILFFAKRKRVWEESRMMVQSPSDGRPIEFPLARMVVDHLVLLQQAEVRDTKQEIKKANACSIATAFVERLKTEILLRSDATPILDRWDVVGGAIELLSIFYERRDELQVETSSFRLPYLSNQLDTLTMPVEFISYKKDPNRLHILSFPFLFSQRMIVAYFRAINLDSMTKADGIGRHTACLMDRFPSISDAVFEEFLLDRLRSEISRFLVLNVRRMAPLEDSFDQLWRRQKRQLLRPLKVVMGSEEGEEGIDQGGVSSEFFRVALTEALDPAKGIFITDPISQKQWLRPMSLEPLYRYELLGLLISLAIYNGMTVPVSFPMVLYQKLLGHVATTPDDIADGWPQLANGLTKLLEWQDGDVGDVFVRTYEFSYEVFDTPMSVDMQHESPAAEKPGFAENVSIDGQPDVSNKQEAKEAARDSSVSGEDAVVDDSQTSHDENQQTDIAALVQEKPVALVTNANREQYVKDYIYWLVEASVEPQLGAFLRGIRTCLDTKSLSLLSPNLIRDLVEGHQHVNLPDLKRIVSYEGFSSNHPLMEGFWDIVQNYTDDERRLLLEFVTANDRIPVNGLNSVKFDIIRNGGDSDRIPSAVTCFGKLLLPEYSSTEKLREKLNLALENSKGFGLF